MLVTTTVSVSGMRNGRAFSSASLGAIGSENATSSIHTRWSFWIGVSDVGSYPRGV